MLFSLILVGGIFLNFAAGDTAAAAVIFCVKPSQPSTTSCSREECHHCNTLQFYFDNANATINKPENINVTLLFMNGTHLINKPFVPMSAPVIKMEAESFHVLIICSSLRDSYCIIFMTSPSNFSFYSIEKIRMTGVWLFALDPSYLTNEFSPQVTSHIKFLYSSYTNVTVSIDLPLMVFFDNCILQNSHVTLSGITSTTVKDSIFWNSKLKVQTSNIVFLGTTELIGAGTKDVYGYDHESTIASYSSNITLSGTMSFTNNLAIRGGAIALHSSTLNIKPGAYVTFTNNFAYDKGGAIYIEPGMSSYDTILNDQDVDYLIKTKPPCFFQLLDCSADSIYLLNFANNSAKYGGDDIYGASIQLSGSICQTSQSNNECNKIIINGVSSELSSISSDPLRVCLCNDEGKPLCNSTYEYSYTRTSRTVYPGEIFTVSAILVGGDFGTTTGMVYAGFLFVNPLVTLTPVSQSITDSSRCGKLKYVLYTNHTHQIDHLVLYLTTSFVSKKEAFFYQKGCNDHQFQFCSYKTPIFINITLLDCPVGFSLTGNPPGYRCECYHTLKDNGVKCSLDNGTGYLLWSSSLWIDTKNDTVTYTKYCPFDYCMTNSKRLNVSSNLDSQCAFNRAGRLCGGCKDNYSLAIGSSHCIHCPNNNNLALLIFFAAAGFLLVFFISALNLTVTKGMINGLIFYANVIKIYQSILISQTDEVSSVLMFLKAFIAWINLDFGIETCFFQGLTAFWKTWLQFIFPLYIWVIALLIVMATKRSSKLTALLGNRAVPVLNTLFLLSYAKLLRVVASAMEFSTLQEYSPLTTHADKRTTVWSADGNLLYFGFPHILLFLAGLATLLFLWLPYTMLLFLLQWLRRLSYVKILKWVTRFHPVYDAYFAPLKHKHQYWFGVLLLVRGILLVTFASTFGISNSINLLILLILGIVLLFYMTLVQPYKSAAVLLLQSSFLINLTVLSGFDIFAYTQPNKQALKDIAFGVSTGIAFIQFCAVVFHSMAGSRYHRTCRKKQTGNESQENAEPMAAVVVNSSSVSLRDSIFEESQKLLIDDP